MPPKYDKITPCTYDKWRNDYNVNFPPGDILVENGDKKGFYSVHGKEIIPPNYYRFHFVTNTKVLLLKNKHNNQGLYDLQQKKTLMPYKYYIDPVHSDSSLLKVQHRINGTLGNYALYDLKGKELLPMDCQKIKALGHNDFLLQQKDSTFSIWNSKTLKSEKLPFQWAIRNDAKFPFGIVGKDDSTPLLTVQQNSKTYLYDYKKRKLLLKNGYADIEQLKNGYFVVTKKDSTDDYTYGYANAKGKLIVPVKYDTKPTEYVAPFEKKYYLPLYKFNPAKSRYITNDYVGYADLKGNVLVPPKYKKVYVESSGKGFIVQKETSDYEKKQFGVINSTGKVVIPLIYSSIIRYNKPREGRNYVKFDFPILC